ncbi:MAG: amidase [Thermodesulfobacteriota bacterium]
MESGYKLPAYELANLIRTKALSPKVLMEEILNRIHRMNPPVNAFVALRADQAMEEAAQLEARIIAGEVPGPLAGVPIGVKDLEDVQGLVTSFGSVPYAHNRVDHDSIQVSRLKAAGAIVVGKTNTPEFGFTGFTKNRLYGVTRNPWNPERTPGGSSGGSAAAVASGMVPLATGSDAGGSIRIPAAYSGCFGFKPSHGTIPLGPVKCLHMTRTWTLGPLTRTVADAALYLDCTAGYHPADPQSLPAPGSSWLETLPHLPSGLNIGFSATLGYARVDREIRILVERAAKTFETLGHHVEPWKGRLPDVTEAWNEMMNFELYGQIHEDLERIRPELGRTLAASLDQAEQMTSRDHLQNQMIRTRLNRAMWEYFESHDLLLTPTVPTEAFAAKGPPPARIDGRSVPLLWAVAFTYPFNLSGHPAATVMAGLTSAGLPAGLQIIGPRYQDHRVLQAAYAYEQATDWMDQRPAL